jgi:hypothetical protein
MKTLVAGWFSFEQMGASAGDLLARDLVCDWLRHADQAFDVALAAPFTGGVDWQSVDPANYSHIVFVCGPLGNGEPVTGFLARFAGHTLVGVNLSMLQPLETWNPFDLLLERDSSIRSNPDLTFGTRAPRVPVVGVVLIDTQPEYGSRDLHESANAAIQRLVASRPMAAVRIDTRLDCSSTGLRSPEEVESLIARMDLVLTTRLHGMVLALKNGVPAVAVDPVAGGAKIQRQAVTIGWPVVFAADALSDKRLQGAYEYCLTEEARAKARECLDLASAGVCRVRDEFIAFLAPNGLER